MLSPWWNEAQVQDLGSWSHAGKAVRNHWYSLTGPSLERRARVDDPEESGRTWVTAGPRSGVPEETRNRSNTQDLIPSTLGHI